MTREEVRDRKQDRKQQQTHDKVVAQQTAGGRNHREFSKERKQAESLTDQRQETAILTRKDLDGWAVTKSP